MLRLPKVKVTFLSSFHLRIHVDNPSTKFDIRYPLSHRDFRRHTVLESEQNGEMGAESSYASLSQYVLCNTKLHQLNPKW